METQVYRFRVEIQKMEIFEYDDAIHRTAQAQCNKDMCVSSFHCLSVFVWEGENYLNTLLVHAFFFSKKIFVLKTFRIRDVWIRPENILLNDL